ncbi:MAG: serine/threonine-protein kinase, partial [Candidatus Limnocylindria bacterium]
KIGDELVPGRRVQEALGGGIRYQAFLTWNEDLLAPTVVKILRPDLVDDEGARRSIAKEGQLLRQIDHPYFMRLLAEDTNGARPFIELEYLDGPRLSTLLRRHGVFVGEQLYPLGRQLAAAIHYLHKQGLLHLDVKPKNIIMGPVPRLIDLSIARRFDEVPKLRSPLGTDAYMAPEQCDRALLHTIVPATDVWGIGVTVYEAATRQLPFPRSQRGGTDEERWPQLVHEPQPPHRKVATKVAALIMSCLERDPAKRPSPLELFDAFDELAARHGRKRRQLRLS